MASKEATAEKDVKRVIVVGRLSYPKLFKPESSFGKDPQYSCELVIPKDSDLSKLKAAMAAAVNEKWPDPKKRPKLKNPLRDGDEDKPNNEQYEGSYFIAARGKNKPAVVIGKDMIPCESESEVYPGRKAAISVTASPFEFKDENGGSARGVKLFLNSVMLLAKDDVRWGGAVGDPETDFEDMDFEELGEDAFGGGDDDDESMFG